jgi:acyl-CoA thioester hydrolase
MSLECYEHPIQVKLEHIDEMNHVNNVVYLQWAQDAAYAHWMTRAPQAIRNQFKWVVLKHEIEYKSQAFLNEALVARTWVYDYSGVKSTRVVQIIRKSDSKLLAEARTLWCLLGTNNRPARITEEISGIFIAEKS